MRIDFHYGPQSTRQADRADSKPATAAESPTKPQLSDDQAQISASHMRVLELTGQVMQIPGIREQRVHSLREAMRNGQFTADPEKTAGALLAEMALGSFRQ